MTWLLCVDKRRRICGPDRVSSCRWLRQCTAASQQDPFWRRKALTCTAAHACPSLPLLLWLPIAFCPDNSGQIGIAQLCDILTAPVDLVASTYSFSPLFWLRQLASVPIPLFAPTTQISFNIRKASTYPTAQKLAPIPETEAASSSPPAVVVWGVVSERFVLCKFAWRRVVDA